MLEAEIKVAVMKPETLRAKLTELGFTFENRVREEDLYFDSPEGAIRKAGKALRIRTQISFNGEMECGRQSLVTFKGEKLDRTTMTRRELETDTKDGEVMRSIFEELGYRPVMPGVFKTRDTYSFGRMHACMDTVEGLGHFLELEIVAEEQESREAVTRELEIILEKLGYSMNRSITTSYLSMLQNTVD